MFSSEEGGVTRSRLLREVTSALLVKTPGEAQPARDVSLERHLPAVHPGDDPSAFLSPRRWRNCPFPELLLSQRAVPRAVVMRRGMRTPQDGFLVLSVTCGCRAEGCGTAPPSPTLERRRALAQRPSCRRSRAHFPDKLSETWKTRQLEVPGTARVHPARAPGFAGWLSLDPW